MAEKKNVKITIGGRTITLSGHESEEYMQEVAAYLNGKRASFADDNAYWKLPEDMRAIMLQLNLADDYFKEKERASELERRLLTERSQSESALHRVRADQEEKVRAMKKQLDETKKLLEKSRSEVRRLLDESARREEGLSRKEADLARQRREMETASEALKKEMEARLQLEKKTGEEIDRVLEAREALDRALDRLSQTRRGLS